MLSFRSPKIQFAHDSSRLCLALLTPFARCRSSRICRSESLRSLIDSFALTHQTLRAGSRSENSSLTERRTASVRLSPVFDDSRSRKRPAIGLASGGALAEYEA